MTNKERKAIEKILSHSATSLVAIILKNLEVLEQNNSLKHEFYRPLVRESIYNHFDYIKKLILNGIEINFEGEKDAEK